LAHGNHGGLGNPRTGRTVKTTTRRKVFVGVPGQIWVPQ
jgi:exosome complex RNA-binding protein Rrp4